MWKVAAGSRSFLCHFLFILQGELLRMAKKEMDRHLSRNGATKEIKKNGAGGKFTWGKPGDEDVEIPVDKKDPSYVSPTEED